MLAEFRAVAGATHLQRRPVARGLECDRRARRARRTARPGVLGAARPRGRPLPRRCPAADADGVTTFLELGPDGVLSAMGQDCLPEDAPASCPRCARTAPNPRCSPRRSPGCTSVASAVDWRPCFAGGRPGGPADLRLPAAALLAGGDTGVGDVTAAGLGAADHPLLGAAVTLAGRRRSCTGRLSLATHPWLADHAVTGLPCCCRARPRRAGLRAGDQVGCDLLEELTAAGSRWSFRSVAECSCRSSSRSPTRTAVATGRVLPAEEAAERVLDPARHGCPGRRAPATASFDEPVWPPAGAEAARRGRLLRRLAAAGFGYGPVFQGVRALAARRRALRRGRPARTKRPPRQRVRAAPGPARRRAARRRLDEAAAPRVLDRGAPVRGGRHRAPGEADRGR